MDLAVLIVTCPTFHNTNEVTKILLRSPHKIMELAKQLLKNSQLSVV